MRFTARAAGTMRVAINRDLRAAVWLALLLLSAALSLFLTWRRLAGALVQPPSGAAFIIAAIALGSAAAILRSLEYDRRVSARSTEYSALSTQLAGLLSLPSRPIASQLLFLLPGMVAILLLAAVTLPGTPTWSIVIAWFLLIAGETVSWLLYLRPQDIAGRPVSSHFTAIEEGADELEIPSGLVQRLTRIREHDRESLHAMVQTEIPAHDRLAVIHLAFCPALAAPPELTAHPVDEETAEVRITQIETFGARIEVRLPRVADERRNLLVEVLGSVTCPPVA